MLEENLLNKKSQYVRRRGRPRFVYSAIHVNEQDIIKIINERHRMKLINKGDMYMFILKYIDEDYKDIHSRNEMLYKLEDYLTEDTLYLYELEFEKFGLCKKDIQKLLHIRRSSMIATLEVNDITYRNLGYHTASIKKGRYHMFWPTDIIKLNGYVPI